ncbi:hypothetical protein BGZ80_007414, partial [Entomortierella chlamydospora]
DSLIQRYTIDYACNITRKLFTDKEWTEVQTYNEWDFQTSGKTLPVILNEFSPRSKKARTLQS